MKYIGTDSLGEEIYNLEAGDYLYCPKCKCKIATEDVEYMICPKCEETDLIVLNEKIDDDSLTFTEVGYRNYIKKIDVTEFCITHCKYCKSDQPVEFGSYNPKRCVTMYCTNCDRILMFLMRND